MYPLAFVHVSDIDEPLRSSDNRGASGAVAVDESSVETLISFGFQPDVARKALKATVSILYAVFLCLKL